MLREIAALLRTFVARPVVTPSPTANSIGDSAATRRSAPITATCVGLLLAALLCACGIKGPLRLPPPATPPAATPAEPAAVPAPAEQPPDPTGKKP